MHTVELLEHALDAAQRLGYRIRQEWLGGNGGGGCEIQGQRWLFLDVGQGPLDQLEQTAEALRGEPGLARLDLPLELSDYLNVRKTA